MTLPRKVQTAIDVLAQYEISADVVAPFWYRQYLRYRPTTPPPLWGASEGYWVFRTLKNASALGVFVILAALAIAWHIASPAEKLLVLTPAAQFAIWTFASVASWLITKAICDWNRLERERIGLPLWRDFSAGWRISSELMREVAALERYWLWSLLSKPLFYVAGAMGTFAFVGFAWALPAKVGSFAETSSLIYCMICLIGLALSEKGKRLSANQAPRQITNGFWAGFTLTATACALFANRFFGLPNDSAPLTLAYGFGTALLFALDGWRYKNRSRLFLRVEYNEQKRRLAEAQLQTLKAQIEPHFIFNTLAHLKSMIASDPKSAERMADELSDFLRASLQALRSESTTVGSEMELARAYLEIAKLRMGSRLSSQIDTGADVANVKIPPLLVQTLLENAIQHGVEPKSTPSEIRVSADLQHDDAGAKRLLVRVADTGQGFSQLSTSGGSGIGLANIRERLQSAYAGRATLRLSANTPSGVIAEIELPVEQNSEHKL
jgi:hypothetical protein